MKSRYLTAIAAAIMLQHQAHADTFRVDDIRVQGLQRISSGAVFSALNISVNDIVDEGDLRNAVRRLFASGNFDDVQIGRDGDTLVIILAERPSINEINIEGNKAIETEALMDGLKGSGLAQGEVFQRSTLEGMEMELRRQYVSQGRYDSDIQTEVVEQPRNRVDVNINIDEGTSARISHINIVGNEVFDDEELMKLFELRSTGMWSFISGDDKYAREKLKSDLETLEAYYKDRGYVAFNVDSTQVSITPQKDAVYIAINITEGVKHKIRDVTLGGDLVLDESILKAFLLSKKGDYFSQALVTNSEEYLKSLLGNEGYHFAKIEGIPDIDEETQEVDIQFFIDPGVRTYVRRVEFRGNTTTLDEVMRREMRQLEGAPANTQGIEHSKVRLERLGFFKEVEVETTEVAGIDDMIDIEYTVEEQHSGSIGASIGYSQNVGMILGVNLQQNNFLGTGQQIGVGLNRSAFQTSYNLSYTDPYYTEDGVSRGFSAFYRNLDYDQINVASYSTNSYGLGMNLGYPISEIERIGLGLTWRNTEVKTGQYAVQEIRSTPFDPATFGTVDYYFAEPRVTPLLDNNGNVLLDPYGNPVDPGSNGVLAPITDLPSSALYWEQPEGFIDLNGSDFDTYTLNLNYVRSTLNRGILATRGGRHYLSLELALPGSDLEYYKLNYSGEQLFPINDIFTFRVKGELGYGNGYGNTTGLPFFQNFYAGGFGSVRGFKDNTLGPLATPSKNYISDCAYQEIVVSGVNQIAQPDSILCSDPSNTGYVMGADGKLLVQDRTSYPQPFGGNVLIQGSMELLFNLPFIEDTSSTRTGLFFDFGNVFSSTCGSITRNCFDIDMNELRYSVGIGATWITAMGPLTFSISRPMNEGIYDRKEIFQFSVGQGF